jgi:HCOMODA/2-hydroxy-3-carboxy-muconic semialdehyde decarboxylase
VNSVIHGHSLTLIKFGVTNTPLKAVFLMGGFLGTTGIPIFDIRTVNPKTNMMVNNNAFGDALTKVLGNHPVALMRGHGQTVVGDSIRQAVVRAYYAEVNARLQSEAAAMGTVTYLSPEEAGMAANGVSIQRPWEMFKSRIGSVE